MEPAVILSPNHSTGSKFQEGIKNFIVLGITLVVTPFSPWFCVVYLCAWEKERTS